jgi:hypothetical protein
MRELQMLSPDVVKQELEEVLRGNNIVFLTSKQATELINKYASREANAQTHLFTELGYKKARFAWGGVKSQKACWYLPSAKPGQGEVLVGGIRAPMGQQVAKVNELMIDPLMTDKEGHRDISYTKNGKREW